MRVSVTNLYTDVTKRLEGTEAQVVAEILRDYPWLRRLNPAEHDVQGLVDELNTHQVYEAQIDEPGDLIKAENELRADGTVAALLGHGADYERFLAGARFLAGNVPKADAAAARRGLWEADGDPRRGALLTYGVEPTDEHLAALGYVSGLAKNHLDVADQAPAAVRDVRAVTDDVRAVTDDGADAAEAVGRAFAERFVVMVNLNGKHSKGAMLARDARSGTTWLLKPDGDPGPAAGAHQEPVGPSLRDAAFYQLAETWGLGPVVPEVHALTLDGRPVAAVKLLPESYEGMDKIWAKDPAAARQILHPYLVRGTAHKWAALYFVAGEVDGHAGNVMAHEGDVRLIDHGSAFAGSAFDPAHDRATWVPFFLRAFAPAGFNKMAPPERRRYLPRLSRQAAAEVGEWLLDRHQAEVEGLLRDYGLDPGPMLVRLAQLQGAARSEPADLVINRAWAET